MSTRKFSARTTLFASLPVFPWILKIVLVNIVVLVNFMSSSTLNLRCWMWSHRSSIGIILK
jgi:hypothetical protein